MFLDLLWWTLGATTLVPSICMSLYVARRVVVDNTLNLDEAIAGGFLGGIALWSLTQI